MKTIKLMLLFILLFAGICVQLNAATLTVTNASNSGAGSIRDQIAAAAPGDSITFDSSTNGIPIMLTTGHIVIDKDLTISGNGIPNTIIDGNNASRIFNITAGNVTIEGLTIQNTATSGQQNGGGIANSGAGIVNIDHCAFLSCSTTGDGGGIATAAGIMNITACTFDGNHANIRGGGIKINGGTVTIEACTFTNNTSTFNGAGIVNEIAGTVIVKNTTISGNSAGNTGGGFRAKGDMTLTNCTIVNNNATSGGGGEHVAGTLMLSNCIVYNNTATEEGPDLHGFFVSGGYNIIGNTSGISGLVVTDMVINPLLDTLADNGGPTKTIALLPCSPAIDAADTATTGTDQRGVAMFGGRRDIGAFEFKCPSASLTGPDTACGRSPQIYTTEAGMTNYAWILSGTAGVDYDIFTGGGAGDNLVELRWKTNGNHTVTISYTDPAYPCCTVTSGSVTTYVSGTTIPFMNGPFNFCAHHVATYTINPAAGTIYTWSIPEPAYSYTIISGGDSADLSITIEWHAFGSRTIRLGYTILATGCHLERDFIVEVHPNPFPEITGDTVICSGNSTTLTVDSYSHYQWSTAEHTQTISVNTPGTYTVTVSNTYGCTASASSSVTGNTTPPSAAVTPASTSITCASPTRILTASGGGTYLWSTGATTTSITVSSANTYTVTATGANGCTASASSSVAVNTTPPSAAVTPPSAVITCTSPTRLLTASGGGTYLWSTGATTTSITVSSVNTYYVTVTGANGCTASASSSVTAPAALTVDAGPNKFVFRGYPDSSCTTLQSTISGGTPPYTRQWTTGNSNLGSGSSLNVCNLTAPKIYYLTVTDANGCSKTDSARVCVFDVRCGSGNKKVTICHGTGSVTNPFVTLCITPLDALNHFLSHPGEKLGTCGMSRTCPFPIMPNRLEEMTEEEYEMSLTAYPNPASETMNISFYSEDSKTYSFRVINITGQILLSETKQAEEGENNFTLNLKGFAAGMYTVLLQSGDNLVQTRIVKQ